ncbi:helix-turn-helix domain-containing protein [Salimicrobium halophilum]|uniref:DNA-binding transcriptional regulator, XRE-family HTH domain n=1 Tax=Salimicrobium halophilum TaxID=86666 RepID=A0A1G8Q6Z7_9BACI|nr:helix-turn-helix transcriptional regulator [Salimicrobium halophilum]SDJ00353.1 DNA-binding transcriptional regulator, XRE-family HTH domain [Salimicrobium halophilum]
MLDERIKQLRKENKYTQQGLADEIEVTSQVVSNWERAYTFPDVNDLRKLAAALHTTSDYLLGLSDTSIDEFSKINHHVKQLNLSPPLFLKYEEIVKLEPANIQQLENYFQFLLQQQQT